MIGQFLEV